MITCSRCGQTKPKEAFYKKPDTKTGRKGQCKACQVKQNKERKEGSALDKMLKGMFI